MNDVMNGLISKSTLEEMLEYLYPLFNVPICFIAVDGKQYKVMGWKTSNLQVLLETVHNCIEKNLIKESQVFFKVKESNDEPYLLACKSIYFNEVKQGVLVLGPFKSYVGEFEDIDFQKWATAFPDELFEDGEECIMLSTKQIEGLQNLFFHFLNTFRQYAEKTVENRSIDKELENQYSFFKNTFEYAPVGFCSVSLDGMLLRVNNAFSTMLGYSEAELLEKSYTAITYPGDLIPDTKEIDLLVEGIIPFYSLTKRYIKKNGSLLWTQVSVTVKRDRFDHAEYLIMVINDLSEQYKAQMNLNQYKDIVISMQMGVLVYKLEDWTDDYSLKLVMANDAASVLIGYDMNPFLDQYINEVFPNISFLDEPQRFAEVIRHQKTINDQEFIFNPGQGESICFSFKAFPIPTDSVCVLFEDITLKKEAEEEAVYLSYHDQLTGLYNRRFFDEEMERFNGFRDLPISIIMADVNGLKLINDTFGHQTGDVLLKKAASIFQMNCRSEDVLARIGGDEFVFLLPNASGEVATAIATRIKHLLDNEKVVLIRISVSFGVSTKRDHEDSIHTIFKRAEEKMYKNKLFESPTIKREIVDLIMDNINADNRMNNETTNQVLKWTIQVCEILKLDDNKIAQMRELLQLYDIGKIAIRDELLNREGSLTQREYNEIKRHSEIGYRILSNVTELIEMAEIVLYHHERYDGLGYPKGLKGNNIPMESRVLALMDAYSAMISERPYRVAMSKEEAIEELVKGAGSQFDPALIDLFIKQVLH